MQTNIQWDVPVEPNWKGTYVYKDERWAVSIFRNVHGNWGYFISERPMRTPFRARNHTDHLDLEDVKAEVKQVLDGLPEYHA